MSELDLSTLRELPAWKSLEESRKLKLNGLRAQILAKEGSLKELAKEIPQNPMGGWFSGAANESLEVEMTFGRIKNDIKALQAEIAKTIRMDTRVLAGGESARYGSLIVALDPSGHTTVYRLVLVREEHLERGIEHVELGCPLADSLLGITEGEEFEMGIYYKTKCEVLKVINN
jgi:transcription elongation GreA/GreB family factor